MRIVSTNQKWFWIYFVQNAEGNAHHDPKNWHITDMPYSKNYFEDKVLYALCEKHGGFDGKLKYFSADMPFEESGNMYVNCGSGYEFFGVPTEIVEDAVNKTYGLACDFKPDDK